MTSLPSRVARVVVHGAVICLVACGDDPAADGGKAVRLAADGGSSAASAPALDAGRADEPEAFSIALSTSVCADGCPAYDLKLDQRGNIEFNGRGYTRQQGWVGKTVPVEAAAGILEALRGVSYWELHDAYRGPSDGCETVEPDRATLTWNVATEGQAKIVVDYLGCTGVSELEALRALPARIRDELGLGSWIGGP